jgi:mannose-6-phosphate isomerase
MANSDNVVRMGLTPKHKDPSRLAELIQCVQPVLLNPKTETGRLSYALPVEEFRVENLRFPEGKEWRMDSREKPEILLISQGEATVSWGEGKKDTFQRGESIFIPACLPDYTLAGTESAEVFRTTVP